MIGLKNLLLLQAIFYYALAARCTESSVKREIQCRHARMKNINPKHFSSTATYFDYSYNYIEKLYNYSFKSYPMITILKLSHNKIEKIETATFSLLHQLEYTDLSHNQLTHLEPSIFDNNSKLKYIKVSYNPLFISSFVSLSLQTLIANNCLLFKIDTNTFSRMPNLQTISLNKTEITPFGEDEVNFLKQLKDFTVQNTDCYKGHLYTGLVYLNNKNVANAAICDALLTSQSNKLSVTVSTICFSLMTILSLSLAFA